MTVTHIGADYTGAQCIKILKGDFDGFSTPDSQVGAFFYNSKWAADVKVTFTWIMPNQPSTIYEPAGSGPGSFLYHNVPASSLFPADSQYKFFRKGFFPNLPYDFPLFDVKYVRISNGRFIGEMVRKSNMTGYQQRGTRWTSSGGGELGWLENFSGFSTVGTVSCLFVQSEYRQVGSSELFSKAISVWRLPGDNTAVRDGDPKAPIAGQISVLINRNALKVAKPGYDVSVATPTQLAFDSANNPAKIIAADDIYLPVGVTDYEVGIAVPYGTVADVHYYDGSVISFPAAPSFNPYGAEYWFSGSKLRFNNTDRACRARFIVIAFDEAPMTAGDNEVLRQFDVDGQDVVQFLRPGSSNNPSFADIALDSRWPCLQILAEGYLPVSANGHQTYTVPFNGDGVFPMVKYMTVHAGGSNSLWSWSRQVRPPFVSMIGIDRIPSPLPATIAGDCTYAELHANQAVFHTFRGAPVRAQYNNASDYDSGTIRYTYDNSLEGLRYYIFGIPRKD